MNRRIKSVLPIICLAIIFTSCQEEEFELSSNTNDMFHIQNGDYIIPVLVRGNTASKKYYFISKEVLAMLPWISRK